MKPSIGSVVHYQSYGTPNGEFLPEPRPLIVTEAKEDGVISATVFQPQGIYFNELPFAETPTPGHWNYPPRGTQKPSLGRTVLYTAAEEDAKAINKRREDFVKHRSSFPSYEDTGYVAHVGNNVRAGDVFAATIVRVFDTSVNLQVHLDGVDTFWAMSVSEGEGPRTWAWPSLV